MVNEERNDNYNAEERLAPLLIKIQKLENNLYSHEHCALIERIDSMERTNQELHKANSELANRIGYLEAQLKDRLLKGGLW